MKNKKALAIIIGLICSMNVLGTIKTTQAVTQAIQGNDGVVNYVDVDTGEVLARDVPNADGTLSHTDYTTGATSVERVPGSGVSSAGEMTTDMAIQQAIGLLGGIPIGQNVKYTFSSGGQLRSYVVCKTSNQRPEAYSTAQYACACVTVGGTCLPPVQQKSIDFTEGGSQSESFSFTSIKYRPHHPPLIGYAKATVSSQVYDGNVGLDAANIDGGFFANGGNDFVTDGGFGSDGWDGFSVNDGGGIADDGTFHITGGSGSGNGGEFITDKTTDFGSYGDGSGSGFDVNTDGWNGDPSNGGYFGSGSDDGWGDTSGNGSNSWEDLISNGGFNAGDDDWASGSGGGDGFEDLDDYLNGAWDGEGLGDGSTTDDLFGLDDSLNAGWGGVDGDPFDGATPAILLDTDGDGVPDAVDFDGDGVADAKLIDTNGDGMFDAIDLNGDGKADGWLIDEDGDGVMDGIDYNGDGIIDQYFEGHEPGAGGEGLNGEDSGLNGYDEQFVDPTEAQLLAMIQQQLAGGGSANQFGLGSGGNSSALGDSVFFNGLLGNDAQNIRRNTASDQEMFDFARDLLKKLGLSEKDMLKGKQYAKDSAWTEPNKAWDFNRITTLLAKKKIKTTSSAQRDQNKPAPKKMGDAMHK